MRKKLAIACVLAGLLASIPGGLYIVGVLSASDFTLEVREVWRRYDPFPGNISLEYTLAVQILGRPKLETLLLSPRFTLSVDGILIGETAYEPLRVQFPGKLLRTILPPYGAAHYLKFATMDRQDVLALATRSSGELQLDLVSRTIAGNFAGPVEKSTTFSWDFPPLPQEVSLSGSVNFTGVDDRSRSYSLVFDDDVINRTEIVRCCTFMGTAFYSISLPNSATYFVSIWLSWQDPGRSRICDVGTLVLYGQTSNVAFNISCSK